MPAELAHRRPKSVTSHVIKPLTMGQRGKAAVRHRIKVLSIALAILGGTFAMNIVRATAAEPSGGSVKFWITPAAQWIGRHCHHWSHC